MKIIKETSLGMEAIQVKNKKWLILKTQMLVITNKKFQLINSLALLW